MKGEIQIGQMENLLYIALAVFGFGLLVFFHELGHYVVAKREGMVIEVFSIGFGKPLIKWKIKEVSWQLGWIPFGGYVRIRGQDGSNDKDIYSIEGGYFQKKPLARIKVALAGPLVNFGLALIFFTIIWATGGRQIPFQESTHVVGYVAPSSESYQLGMRPGDVITSVNNEPFTNFHDLIQASLTNPNGIEISGFSINDQAQKVPFTHTFKVKIDADQPKQTLDRIQSLLPASYLIYDKSQSFPFGIKNLPISKTGIEDKDRVVWMDGMLLYSQKQVNEMLHEKAALLTIQRGKKTFTARVLRTQLQEFYLDEKENNEFEDWAFELKLNQEKSNHDLNQLYFIPYALSMSGVVESDLNFIEKRSKISNETLLQKGDRILAVDGKRVSNAYEIFQKLQTQQHLMIVQRNPKLLKTLDFATLDSDFDALLQKEQIERMMQHIGTDHEITQLKDLVLLKPVEAVSIHQMAKEDPKGSEIQNQIQNQKFQIQKIANSEKRSELLASFDQQLEQPFLGLTLQDRKVDYNPNPFVSFGKVVKETIGTLTSLIQGKTSPKWLSGPVGIFQVMHIGFSLSIKQGLFWMAAISLNLAILNLLPIPPLDGGHITFSLYEWITRKKVSSKTMHRVTLPFVVLLISLFIFVTFQDLSRLFHKFF